MNKTTFTLFTRKKEENQMVLSSFISKLEENGFILDRKDPELVIVFGGDGSLLKAFHEFKFKGKYVLLNTGHLGFFSDYSKDEVDKLAYDIINKEYKIEKHPLLRLNIEGRSFKSATDIALQSERTMELEIHINDQYFTKTRCSGMVIGTKIGSTGFLLSLDSPVVVSSDELFLYSFIAPVYNKLFPNSIDKAILGKDDELTIKILDGRIGLFTDGIYLGEVERSSLKIRLDLGLEVSLIHFKNVSHIDRIRKSLDVGGFKYE